MSKHFELLQRADEEELFIPVGLPKAETRKSTSSPFTKVCLDGEIPNLVHRLFLQNAEVQGPRVVAFSAIASDRRSGSICAQTARSLAGLTTKSVCVVDANFWSPQLQSHFRADNIRGLAEALTAAGPIRSFATALRLGDLWLLPTGSARLDVFGQLDECRARFAELRDQFHYIIISAPPVTRETEATLMGQLADGMVLIVDANESRRDAVLRAKERLESAQVQLLGAVLDQRTFPIPEFLYRKL